MISTKTIKIFT